MSSMYCPFLWFYWTFCILLAICHFSATSFVVCKGIYVFINIYQILVTLFVCKMIDFLINLQYEHCYIISCLTRGVVCMDLTNSETVQCPAIRMYHLLNSHFKWKRLIFLIFWRTPCTNTKIYLSSFCPRSFDPYHIVSYYNKMGQDLMDSQ